MTSRIEEARRRSDAETLRILIGIHGYEPVGWGAEACRAVARWPTSIIRLLAVLDMATPPFSSLIPWARRAYRIAVADWRRREEARVQALVDEVLQVVPGRIDVVRVEASRGADPGRMIAEHARRWRADVVVVAPPKLEPASWLWPGHVHQRVVRHASCAVLVTAPSVKGHGETPGVRRLLRSIFSGRQAVAVKGGV